MNACRSAATAAATALVCITTVCAAPDTGYWPGFLGPNRDGRSPDTGLLKQWPTEGPKLLWKANTLGAGWGSVAVVSGCVYTTGNKADGSALMLIALDAADGKEKWRVAQGPACKHDKYPAARSTPTLDGDRIYVLAGEGRVTCHDALTGKMLWSRECQEMGGKVGNWRYAESVLVLGKVAFVTPGGKNAVVALDKLTGKTLWSSDAEATAGYSSCLALRQDKAIAIVNGTQDGLFAFDGRTGKKLWSSSFAAHNTANCPSPLFSDGMLVWIVGYKKGAVGVKAVCEQGAWTFNEAWHNSDLSTTCGGGVIDNGYVYGAAGSDWACVDLKTGKTKWKAKAFGSGSVCYADGMLYLYSDNGGMIALAPASPAELKIVSNFSVAGKDKSWAYPVVTGGRLYLRYDTNLYCFDVQAH